MAEAHVGGNVLNKHKKYMVNASVEDLGCHHVSRNHENIMGAEDKAVSEQIQPCRLRNYWNRRWNQEMPNSWENKSTKKQMCKSRETYLPGRDECYRKFQQDMAP